MWWGNCDEGIHVLRGAAARAAPEGARGIFWHLRPGTYLVLMDDNDADRYLRQANACLEEAQNATRVADKEAWLKLSEEWMAMAEKAQRETPHEH
ncbi:hypothetical protein CO683_03800 [Bradyrhizobium ottawaense]|nr:hypothetical protein CO683_03800 [Bradyrhizobium ottawaense]